MAMKVEEETKSNQLFDVKLNTKRLEELVTQGVVPKQVKDDIAVQAWATTLNPNQHLYNFDSPFLDVTKSEKDLSYAQKVAQSIKMLYIALDGVSTGRGSSYGHSDYLTSDFDFIMSHRVEEIVEDIFQHIELPQRVRVNSSFSVQPFFIRYDFRNEVTELFMENGFPDERARKEEAIVRLFETGREHNMIIPFSILPAFPVYNVDSITLVGSRDEIGGINTIRYSAESKNRVSLPGNFFSM